MAGLGRHGGGRILAVEREIPRQIARPIKVDQTQLTQGNITSLRNLNH